MVPYHPADAEHCRGQLRHLFRPYLFLSCNELSSAALENILSSSGGTVIDCPSTGASVTIEFGVPIDSTASGSFSGSTVTFSASDLESTPTDFDVILDVCGEVPGGSIVVSATYTDDQGNDPDLSALTGLVVGTDFCEAPTPSPTSSPTPSPKMPPSPRPTMKKPKRGKGLKKGSVKKAKYLGCYKAGPRHNPLSGYKFSSRHMTAQVRQHITCRKNEDALKL